MSAPKEDHPPLSYFEQRYSELVSRVNANDINTETAVASAAILGLGVEISKAAELQNIESALTTIIAQLDRINTAIRD